MSDTTERLMEIMDEMSNAADRDDYEKMNALYDEMVDIKRGIKEREVEDE